MWGAFKKGLRLANKLFGQKSIKWKKCTSYFSEFMEHSGNFSFEEYELKGLIQYNVFRTWSIDLFQDSGQVDNENCAVYFNVQYLKEFGDFNEFDFNSQDFLTGILAPGNYAMFGANDRFIIDGIEYRISGHTVGADIPSTPGLFMIILQRTSYKNAPSSQDFG